jgi:glycosyltransferase involved in cell wall biosynthesis
MRPLVWVGHFRGTSGFATATREYARAFIRHYPDIVVAPLAVLESSDPFAPFVKEAPQGAFELVHHLPTTDPEADAYFSVVEYDRVLPEWEPLLENAKVVFTQSEFCRSIFKKVVTDPGKIHVVPYILPASIISRRNRLHVFPPDKFIVGSVFEWVPRKAPDLLLQAFVEEFRPSEPVLLALLTYNAPPAALKRILGRLEGNKNIRVIPAPIVEIGAFYRSLNCYISCTAGEGYGQTLAEAMACGVPTIGSRHSGNLDFMTDENSYLVGVGGWTPSDENPGQRWKLPKVDEMRVALRAVYDIWERGEANLRARRATSLRKQLTPWHASRILMQGLRAFLFE